MMFGEHLEDDYNQCHPAFDVCSACLRIQWTFSVLLQPVISDEPLEGDNQHRVVKFDRTPIMPTYLLAMIVGEYDFVEARDSDGVLVRVYTPVGKKEQGQFALNVSIIADNLGV